MPAAGTASQTAAEATSLQRPNEARITTRAARKAPATLALADPAPNAGSVAAADSDAAHPATPKTPGAQEQALDRVTLLTGDAAPNRAEADASGSTIGSTSPASDDGSTDPASSAISASLNAAPVAALFLAAPTPATARPVALTDDTPGSGSNAGRPLGAVTAAATGSSAPGLTALLTNTAHAQSDAAQTALTTAGAASPDGGTAADAATADSAGSATSATSAPDATASAAAALAHLAAATHASGRDSDLPRSELRAPVGTPDWNNELGQQLTWMSHKGIDSASLRLSPAHLGPLEVQISVQNGAASVWFGASHADTRAALERALPQLRQMFASQGLALTDSGVSREPPRNSAGAHATHGIAGVSAVGAPAAGSAAPAVITLGLIDIYA